MANGGSPLPHEELRGLAPSEREDEARFVLEGTADGGACRRRPHAKRRPPKACCPPVVHAASLARACLRARCWC
eukprot:2058816-Pyramimonas_sp.AAC.1